MLDRCCCCDRPLPYARSPALALRCGNTCVPLHTHCCTRFGRHLCHVLPVGQQCGWRAEYRRSRRTTGTAGTTFDANMDSLQQIHTPWIRSDGDAWATTKSSEFKRHLVDGSHLKGVDGAWRAHECCRRRSSRCGLRPRRLPEVGGRA